ncbi:hypothetical protein I2494_20085 [Budviciaceae bacterium BWR-B9]|uniref:Uncharacterized protein n=1 Tax=Limnobaculum allomyrinae TaxID=2791986 RepID=A0ABS1IW24_9GAMM|nr:MULTISPECIES: hypothetical protein [Limnobaculum]MBK5145972.1 hypothetical protein [Limnobaculum allomyrinae]MBV7693973.1 hypothetical protein [Limnobaculum sp. M2-1]
MNTIEIINLLREWHQEKVDGISLLVEHADKPMDFGNGKTKQLAPEEIKPFRLGVKLALIILGDFPITLNGEENDE